MSYLYNYIKVCLLRVSPDIRVLIESHLAALNKHISLHIFNVKITYKYVYIYLNIMNV